MFEAFIPLIYSQVSDVVNNNRHSRYELEEQTREQKRHNREMERISCMSEEERKEYLKRKNDVDVGFVAPILKDFYSKGIDNLLFR